MESIGRILRIGLALIGPPLLVFMLLPGNAQAYTRTVATGSLHAPYMHYTKGTTNTNGYLTAWVSYSSGNRYRTVMQAGSGTWRTPALVDSHPAGTLFAKERLGYGFCSSEVLGFV